MSDLIVEFNNVSVAFDDKPVLQDISFNIHVGEFWGILGPNGSGKTTLLKTLIGLIKPYTGTVKLFGKDPNQLNRERSKIGYVSQQNQIDPNFPLSVLDVVLLGRAGKIGLGRRPKAHDKSAAHEALYKVDMEDFANQRFGDLSGGQKQRVLIARALAVQPQLLLLDEPTSALDVNASESFYDWLDSMRRQLNLTVVMVSHDIGVVSSFITQVACLNKTLVAHGVPDKVFTSDTLSAMYGCDAVLFHHGKIPHMVVAKATHEHNEEHDSRD